MAAAAGRPSGAGCGWRCCCKGLRSQVTFSLIPRPVPPNPLTSLPSPPACSDNPLVLAPSLLITLCLFSCSSSLHLARHCFQPASTPQLPLKSCSPSLSSFLAALSHTLCPTSVSIGKVWRVGCEVFFFFFPSQFCGPQLVFLWVSSSVVADPQKQRSSSVSLTCI